MIDLNKTAIIAGEHNVTYSELLQRVAQYARQTPKGKQTKTVIFSENREGWAYAFFSVWQNEGVAVPIDASSTASDVAYILNDCKPDAIWVSRDREAVLREALSKQRAGSKEQENTYKEQGAGCKEQENTNSQNYPPAPCPLPLAPCPLPLAPCP